MKRRKPDTAWMILADSGYPRHQWVDEHEGAGLVRYVAVHPTLREARASNRSFKGKIVRVTLARAVAVGEGK